MVVIERSKGPDLPCALVVGDVAHGRGRLGIRLAEAGFRVESAADRRDALARVSERYPDIVVTNHEPSGMDGIGLVRCLRATSGVPVVVIATEGSIKDLEAAIGIAPSMLEHTVEIYNRHAVQGEDPLFHKQPEWLKPLDEPPYAAIECSFGKALYAAFTLGGLRTRPSGEVLDEAGREIPGLFAAGRNACGIPRSAWGYCSGTSIADATLFGRKAGISAALNEPGVATRSA